MVQYAWLDSSLGVWHLVTEEDNVPVRYWRDKRTALAELAEEGWILTGPLPRRYRRRWVMDRTIALIRFVR
jgi:hypothetical protein